MSSYYINQSYIDRVNTKQILHICYKRHSDHRDQEDEWKFITNGNHRKVGVTTTLARTQRFKKISLSFLFFRVSMIMFIGDRRIQNKVT